jgi:RNA polymerase sigma-70 factor (ECF subfamily)
MSANDTSPPPLSPSLGDEELMRELAAGRPEAIDQLHARYGSLIYGVAARSLDRANAEEISQEVFLAVWRHAASFDPSRGTFRAWVLQITRRSVLNELRRRGRRPRSTTQSESSSGDHLPDPGPDPAESVWREHRRASCGRPCRPCPLLSVTR